MSVDKQADAEDTETKYESFIFTTVQFFQPNWPIRVKWGVPFHCGTGGNKLHKATDGLQS